MASAQNLHTKQQKNHTGHGESITAIWAGPNDLRAIADKDMKLFNDFLADRHWLEGLFTTNIESIATRVDCFTQRSQGLFQKIICAENTKLAVDIGAGAGNVSEELAEIYESVIALDYNSELLRFIKKRFDDDKLTNITTIETSLLDIPIQSEIVDFVNIFGMLELVPAFTPSGTPRRSQVAFLKNVHSILKSEGFICIATKNKNYYENYLKNSEPIWDTPVKSPILKPLRKVAKIFNTNQNRLNSLFAPKELTELLTEIGFKKILVYDCYPTYNRPQLIRLIKRGSMTQNFSAIAAKENKNLKYILKLIIDYLIPSALSHSFFIVGKKA